MRRQSGEKLCKSIIKCLARRNRERHAMLTDVEDEQKQDVIFFFFDDITSKELPWHAVRKARELELKYLRDLGEYEKVDEKEAVSKHGIIPVDKMGCHRQSFRGGAHADQITNVRERVTIDQTCMQGLPPLEALKAITSSAANNKETFFNHAHRCVTCVFPHDGPEPVLTRLPVEDRMCAYPGKVGLMKKSMYGTRDAASD